MEAERISIQAMKSYPDISKLIKAKATHRRALAALPFEKKIELVFKLQQRRRFLKSAQLLGKRRAKAASVDDLGRS